jgi:SAM-dependent methyltransferase
VDFVREAAARLELSGPVVEIGSRPAAGQENLADLRPLFDGVDYIGCDLRSGPGVDRIEDVHALTFADASVGTVLALDTLEHVADPLRAVAEIARILRPGGVVLMSSVMFFPIHEHPWDYWRFTPEGLDLVLGPFEQRLVMALGWNLMPETVFGVGVKGPITDPGKRGLSVGDFPATARMCSEWGVGIPVDLGPIRLGIRQLWAMTLRESLAFARRRLRIPGVGSR